MKTTSFFLFATLVSSGLALSIPLRLPSTLDSRAETHNAIAPEDVLNPVVRPRECEEPAEPAEPSEADRKKGAKRPARPSRPTKC
ncbi:hypothetical protein CNYM01_02060 [Colletotrichum nymphaeae SA-01]|uniref:Uncharacterized protein n=1 Tax=Colletotrichum nymphaeae SA-01 TaxID=1460502 RepID=A0A135UWG0_9PEZI|nr:hypothetical protein CNYM01_02060 [Colletotrichum nymphaeae SA-01]